jgi:hypothetical protein
MMRAAGTFVLNLYQELNGTVVSVAANQGRLGSD